MQKNLNHGCLGTLFIYSYAIVVLSKGTRNSQGHPKYSSPSALTFPVEKSAITRWSNGSPHVIGQDVQQACQLTNQVLRNKTQGNHGLARFPAPVIQSTRTCVVKEPVPDYYSLLSLISTDYGVWPGLASVIGNLMYLYLYFYVAETKTGINTTC